MSQIVNHSSLPGGDLYEENKHDFYDKSDFDVPDIVKDRNGEICLAYCKICRCAEGSLPTHCPGGKVDIDTQDLIYENKLNYVYGKWVKFTNDKWVRLTDY